MSELENFDYKKLDIFTMSQYRIPLQDSDKVIKSITTSELFWGGQNIRDSYQKLGIYRGWNIGTAVTDKQWDVIRDGTFRDMFIGDYWNIGGVKYVIADFNYFKYLGDGKAENGTRVDKNHVTIVPQSYITSEMHVMNDTNTTEGGYIGCKMRTETIPNKIMPIINAAFGSEHILKTRRKFVNSINQTTGEITGSLYVDSYVDLMDVGMVFAGFIEPIKIGDTAQLSLFRLISPIIFIPYNGFYLCNPGYNAHDFLSVSGNRKSIDTTPANHPNYRCRPVFSIYAE